MRNRLGILAIIAIALSLPTHLKAQAPAVGLGVTGFGGTTTQDMFKSNLYREERRKGLAGRVVSLKGGVLSKASVQVTNNAGSAFQQAITDKGGDFHVEFSLYDESFAKHFVATFKVTRKGFRTAYKNVTMDESTHDASFIITLRPIEPEDPNLLSEAELVKTLSARLGQLGPADGLLPKAQKDYARGMAEFTEGVHLDKAVADLAKAWSASPACLKCRTMLAVAELNWGDYDDAWTELAESVNAIIKDSKVGSPEPLLGLGAMVSWKHDPGKASLYFLHALTYAPKDPLALQELGRAQSQELFWYPASQTLKKAIDAGAGPEAILLHAEALVRVGTPKEATDELNRYVAGRPFKSMPPRCQKLRADIQEMTKNATAIQEAREKARERGVEPLDYIHHPPLKGLKDFEPASDQKPI